MNHDATEELRAALAAVAAVQARRGAQQKDLNRVVAIIQEHDRAVRALNKLDEQRQQVLATALLAGADPEGGESWEPLMISEEYRVARAKVDVAAERVPAANMALAEIRRRQAALDAELAAAEHAAEPARNTLAVEWLKAELAKFNERVGAFAVDLARMYAATLAFNDWAAERPGSRSPAGGFKLLQVLTAAGPGLPGSGNPVSYFNWPLEDNMRAATPLLAAELEKLLMPPPADPLVKVMFIFDPSTVPGGIEHECVSAVDLGGGNYRLAEEPVIAGGKGEGDVVHTERRAKLPHPVVTDRFSRNRRS